MNLLKHPVSKYFVYNRKNYFKIVIFFSKSTVFFVLQSINMHFQKFYPVLEFFVKENLPSVT